MENKDELNHTFLQVYKEIKDVRNKYSIDIEELEELLNDYYYGEEVINKETVEELREEGLVCINKYKETSFDYKLFTLTYYFNRLCDECLVHKLEKKEQPNVIKINWSNKYIWNRHHNVYMEKI